MSGIIGNSYRAFNNFVGYYTHRFWQSAPQDTTDEALRQLSATLHKSMEDLYTTQELFHQLAKDYQSKVQALEQTRGTPQQESAKEEYQRNKAVWEEAGNEVRLLTERVNKLASDVQQKLSNLRH